MIRVTVELLPLGSEQRRESLGQLNIVNDGTGDSEVGNYDVTLIRPTPSGCGRLVKHVRVTEHDRAEGWLPLIRRAVEYLDLPLQ